jgi:hypothetical protein
VHRRFHLFGWLCQIQCICDAFCLNHGRVGIPGLFHCALHEIKEIAGLVGVISALNFHR